MTKAYDNWGRLVKAVVRRERDRQIALSLSISSTSSSFDLGISSFDHRETKIDRIPMDYSDLTLGHNEWKSMLPPGKHEVIWRSASLRFFLDRGTSGKNCFLIGAVSLVISSIGGEDRPFETNPHPQSRFSEVVELTHPELFQIHGRIKTKMLSPDSLYAAYLVFKCSNVKYEEMSLKPTSHTESHIALEENHGSFLIRYYSRIDGWMEMELGDFYVGLGGVNEEAVVQILNLSGIWSNGLIIEGIEFRPLN